MTHVLAFAIPFWVTAIITVLFLFVCILLMLAVLIQRPAGGGLSGAFGSGAGSGQTAFGAKTGDALTIATIAIFFVYLCFAVGLNYAARPQAIPTTPTAASGTGAATGSTGSTAATGAPAATAPTSPAPSGAATPTGATGSTAPTAAPAPTTPTAPATAPAATGATGSTTPAAATGSTAPTTPH